MSDVHSSFIEPMLKIFERPPGSSAEGFFGVLIEDLERYSDDTLGAAVKVVRQTRKYHTFPSIGECVAACRKVEEEAASKVVVLRKSQEPSRLSDDDHYRRACRLCRCDLGRTADRDHWLPALIDFARENNRLPVEGEAGRLRGTAWRAREAIAQTIEEGVERRAGPGVGNMLADFRRRMLLRASKDVFGSVQEYLPAVETQPEQERVS